MVIDLWDVHSIYEVPSDFIGVSRTKLVPLADERGKCVVALSTLSSHRFSDRLVCKDGTGRMFGFYLFPGSSTPKTASELGAVALKAWDTLPDELAWSAIEGGVQATAAGNVLVVADRELRSLLKFNLRNIITPERNRRFVRQNILKPKHMAWNAAAMHQMDNKVMYLERGTLAFGCLYPGIRSWKTSLMSNSKLKLDEMERKDFPSENEFVALDSRFLYVLYKCQDKTNLLGYQENSSVVKVYSASGPTKGEFVKTIFLPSTKRHVPRFIYVYEKNLFVVLKTVEEFPQRTQ